MELRPYQINGITDIRSAFRFHKRVLYTLPTGGGKTTMFSYMARRHIEKANSKVVIGVHRAELLEQVCEELKAQGQTQIGIISPDHRPRPDDQIVVASIPTLARRIGEYPSPTLFIADEAHHSTARTQWGRIIAHYDNAYVLGVTATPSRLSGEGLSDCFSIMVRGPTTRRLIADGYLAKPHVYCPSVPDLSSVHTRGGDYVSSELAKILGRSTINGNAVEAYKKRAIGKTFVAFAVSVSHAHKIASLFSDAGYSAAAVDGGMGEIERKRTIAAFRNGTLLGLVSCQLIDEGFNVPGIECGIDLSPTQSLSRYLQRIGRCLRRTDCKSEAVILDLAGNALRHGLPDSDQNWTLEGSKHSGGKNNDRRIPSVRICDSCLAANRSTSDSCVQCGHIFPINGRTFIQQHNDLALLDERKAEEIAAKKKLHEENRKIQTQTKGYSDLVALGRQRGYRNPEHWAWIIHQSRLQKRKRIRI